MGALAHIDVNVRQLRDLLEGETLKKRKKMTPEKRAAWAEGEQIQRDLRDRMKGIEIELAEHRKKAG